MDSTEQSTSVRRRLSSHGRSLLLGATQPTPVSGDGDGGAAAQLQSYAGRSLARTRSGSRLGGSPRVRGKCSGSDTADAAPSGAVDSGCDDQVVRARKLSAGRLTGLAPGASGARSGAAIVPPPPPPMLSQAAEAARDTTGEVSRRLSDEAEQLSARMRQQAELKAQQSRDFAAAMENGIRIIKHGRSGKPHERVLFIPRGRPTWIPRAERDYRCVCWVKPPSAPGAPLNETQSSSLQWSLVRAVQLGNGTDVFQRSLNQGPQECRVDAPAELCFSLLADDRSLDIQCETANQCALLVNGFKIMLGQL